MTGLRIAPVMGLALLLTAGCMNSAEDRAADASRAATAELNRDVRSTLDQFGTRMERLDQRYMSATDEVAAAWVDTRSEMRETREEIEAHLTTLASASAEDARRLRGELAEDIERLTERLERTELESVEDANGFLSASRDRMVRLEEDFRTLGNGAASLSAEARQQASGPLDALRRRAREIGARLDGLTNATSAEIASQRTDIAQAISNLTASVRREIFEMNRAVTE